MVTGRALEVQDFAEVNKGETNFIMVDCHNLLKTATDEIMYLDNYRKTLQVQFYGEVCVLVFGQTDFHFQLFCPLRLSLIISLTSIICEQSHFSNLKTFLFFLFRYFSALNKL
jgi:hypothetical protein